MLEPSPSRPYLRRRAACDDSSCLREHCKTIGLSPPLTQITSPRDCRFYFLWETSKRKQSTWRTSRNSLEMMAAFGTRGFPLPGTAYQISVCISETRGISTISEQSHLLFSSTQINHMERTRSSSLCTQQRQPRSIPLVFSSAPPFVHSHVWQELRKVWHFPV